MGCLPSSSVVPHPRTQDRCPGRRNRSHITPCVCPRLSLGTARWGPRAASLTDDSSARSQSVPASAVTVAFSSLVTLRGPAVGRHSCLAPRHSYVWQTPHERRFSPLCPPTPPPATARAPRWVLLAAPLPAPSPCAAPSGTRWSFTEQRREGESRRRRVATPSLE